MSSWEANVHTTRDEFSRLKNLTRLFVHKEPLNSFALFNFNFFIGFSFFSTELLHKPIPTFGASSAYREQQQRRRLRKRHLKSEFALLQTLSRFFHLVQFVKCWQFFLELNSKILYQSSGKEKETRCLVFTSSTKCDSVTVTAKKMCTKKCDARAELLFCQTKPVAFLPFSLTSPSKA